MRHSPFTVSTQCCSVGGGAQGVQAHTQNFSSGENLGSICGILGKLPENTGKNCAQRALTWKNGAQYVFIWKNCHPKSHEDLFLEVIRKTVFNIRTKSSPKVFWASLGKFGQKSLAPPTICLLLHFCFYSPCIVSSAAPMGWVYPKTHENFPLTFDIVCIKLKVVLLEALPSPFWIWTCYPRKDLEKWWLSKRPCFSWKTKFFLPEVNRLYD